MSRQSQKRRIVTGVLAHVDAGKTTLLEALLYESGTVRKLGSVDKKNSNLDTFELERSRGITIFSKQLSMTFGDTEFDFLDTPGHVDLSPETERTLQVLDYCVLVVDAIAGVKEHTLTLWKLLDRYRIPTIIFVNKMDRRDADKQKALRDVKSKLSAECIDFSDDRNIEEWSENVAMCREDLLEAFLDGKAPSDEAVSELVSERLLFPVFFGSALKLEGVKYFAEEMAKIVCEPEYGDEFSAKVFKISRNADGTRLAHLKVTGGKLTSKMKVGENKVEQIKVCSGAKLESVPEVEAGGVCVVTGLDNVRAGDCIGTAESETPPVLVPTIQCELILPPEKDASQMMQELKLLEEEEPMLSPEWIEETGSIRIRFMGQIQTEVVQKQIENRFGVHVEFGRGRIIYKETIAAPVMGAGHFEPLRHFAEVHLLIEPAERGNGLTFESRMSTDLLAGHWQRLILSQLKNCHLKGVLTRSEFTDAKIILVGGKAHPKHTEGGDFGQAARRAFRQALMKAENVLLEPWYNFVLTLPQKNVGRALNDLSNMGAKFEAPEIEGETAVITGCAPASEVGEYQQELTSYSGGQGRIVCTPSEFRPCVNAEEVIKERGYDPETDRRNPADSVFCTHGSGYTVPWWEADELMHVQVRMDGENIAADDVVAEGIKGPGTQNTDRAGITNSERKEKHDYDASRALDAELEQIFNRTYGTKSEKTIKASTYGKTSYGRAADERIKKIKTDTQASVEAIKNGLANDKRREEYLLVDGYNIIFAWDDLNELAKSNVDAARMRLAEELSNYCGYKGNHIILVFDAYKVKGHACESFKWHNIEIVYTAEAQTADAYIEKTAHEMSGRYDVKVATSDRLEQIIIFGSGASRISAGELKKELEFTKELIMDHINEKKGTDKRNYLLKNFKINNQG